MAIENLTGLEKWSNSRLIQRPERQLVDSSATLLWGVVFGAVGLAYFVYGKRQQRFITLFCGIGLMAFPYFVSNTIVLVIVGLALSVIPYFFRL